MKTGIDIKQLKKYILEMYGERCERYVFGCNCCRIWRFYEDIESFYEDAIWNGKKELQHRKNVEL